MRKAAFFLLTASLVFALGFKVEKLWETSAVFSVPESVLYDPEGGVLYVSSIGGSPTAKDGNGFISKMGRDGKILSLRWATGLDAPKGMAVYRGSLYVSDIDKLVQIDLSTGRILRKYPAPGARFLNDVAVDSEGRVYVSDSSPKNSVIYKLEKGRMEVWLKNPAVKSPNGIFYRDGKLYIGSFSDGRIFACHVETGKIRQVARAPMVIDGLILDDSMFILSDWQGRVGILQDGRFQLLLDLSAGKANAADLGFIPGEKIILIPTFFANTVAAYKLNEF